MKSHLDTQCPCYCPYCDVTAEREVISRDHKGKCYKIPLVSTNTTNTGVENVLPDKLNKAQKDILPVNKMLTSNMLVELQETVSTMRREAAQSVQIAKEHSEKDDKQNSTAILNQQTQLYLYLTIAVLVIAILIAAILQVNSLQKRLEEDSNKHILKLNSLQNRLEEDSNKHILKLNSLQNRLEEDSIKHILKLNSLQNRLEEDTKIHKQNFIKLQEQNALLQEVLNKATADLQYYYRLSSSVWSTKLWLSSELSNQIAPVIVKMPSFTKKVMNKEGWNSSLFFAFEEGYQMHLKVDAGGYGEGTHISVFLRLVKGPYDDKLQQSGHWPLRGTFIIELLNQLNDSDHYIRILQFHHYRCSKCANRVLEGDRQTIGYGYHQFISHDLILHHSNNSYHMSDFLIFRITYEDLEAPYQVAPVTFKVAKFSLWFKSAEDFYTSPPFFAYEGGYQMRLQVYAGGYGNAHVSVFLHLIEGPYDDKLEQSGHWPLRGAFTIELLNQLNDSNHYSKILQFHHYVCSNCTNRLLIGNEAYALGYSQFISYDTLLHHNINNYSYYKSDCLIFRITYEDMEAPYQVAPVTFKLTKFSYWLKSKAIWKSSSFFAFEEGYQFYLKVNAGSTHVSVYLYLTEGPHDDELEQLQLRGVFTIELLNQLNDNDHYNSTVKFDTTRSVNEEYVDDDVMIEAIDKYISHTTLLQHNSGYLKDDMLTFRISYSKDSKGN